MSAGNDARERGRRRVGALYELPELRYPAAAAAAAGGTAAAAVAAATAAKPYQNNSHPTRYAQLPVVQHIIEIRIARPSSRLP